MWGLNTRQILPVCGTGLLCLKLHKMELWEGQKKRQVSSITGIPYFKEIRTNYSLEVMLINYSRCKAFRTKQLCNGRNPKCDVLLKYGLAEHELGIVFIVLLLLFKFAVRCVLLRSCLNEQMNRSIQNISCRIPCFTC